MHASPAQKQVSLSDFEILHLVGEGSFGKVPHLSASSFPLHLPVAGRLIHSSHYLYVHSTQVFQVRKKDTGQVYAMKVLKKKKLVDEGGALLYSEVFFLLLFISIIY
jgi:serine/threonine protein kinase